MANEMAMEIDYDEVYEDNTHFKDLPGLYDGIPQCVHRDKEEDQDSFDAYYQNLQRCYQNPETPALKSTAASYVKPAKTSTVIDMEVDSLGAFDGEYRSLIENSTQRSSDASYDNPVQKSADKEQDKASASIGNFFDGWDVSPAQKSVDASFDKEIRKAMKLSMKEAEEREKVTLLHQIGHQAVVNEQMEEVLKTELTGKERFEEENSRLQQKLLDLECAVREARAENNSWTEEASRLEKDIEERRGGQAVVRFEEKLRLKDEVIGELKAERDMLEEAFSAQQEIQNELEEITAENEALQLKYDSLFSTFQEMKAAENEYEAVRTESAGLKLRLTQRNLLSNEIPNIADLQNGDAKISALSDLVQSTCSLFSAEESNDSGTQKGEIEQLKTQIATMSQQMTELIVDTRAIKENMASQQAVEEHEDRKLKLQEQCKQIEQLTMTLQGNQPNRFVDYSKNFVALALIIILML